MGERGPQGARLRGKGGPAWSYGVWINPPGGAFRHHNGRMGACSDQRERPGYGPGGADMRLK